LLRATLVPAALTGFLSAPFAALFGPVAAVSAMVLIASAAAYWSATQRVPPPMRGDEFAAGCALFVISCLVHELGHAGACVRFGVRPGPIGVALYLMFPVFYTDVTRIWRLRRWQRVVVDGAGSHVQCLCGAGYVLAYAHTKEAAFFVATNLIVVTTLLNMNPLFRFDGYWLLSDALGVSGLMRHVGRFLGGILVPRKNRKDVCASHWPRHILIAVSMYSVAALAGWAWFVVRLAVGVLEQGRRLLVAGPALAAHREPLTFAVGDRLGAVVAGCLALGVCVFKVVRFVRRTAVRP
jgi:putative peptide zinc metalloprotease protein